MRLQVTHHGLDVMLRRILSEMALLVADADDDAAYNGTRYTTMFAVGTKDLYEGLQSSTELFVDFSISRCDPLGAYSFLRGCCVERSGDTATVAGVQHASVGPAGGVLLHRVTQTNVRLTGTMLSRCALVCLTRGTAASLLCTLQSPNTRGTAEHPAVPKLTPSVIATGTSAGTTPSS